MFSLWSIMDEEERLCKARAKAKIIREERYARERRLLQDEIDASTHSVDASTEMPVVDRSSKTQVVDASTEMPVVDRSSKTQAVDQADEDEVTVTITIKKKGNGDILKLVNLCGLVNP